MMREVSLETLQNVIRDASHNKNPPILLLYCFQVPSRYKQFKLFCNHVAESSKYSEIIMSIIVLNTICMAVEHYNEVS